MKTLITLFLMLLLPLLAAAQPPDTLWTRTYGGGGWDAGGSVQQTIDGGYIIAGGTASYGAGNNDIYLIKTDAAGNQAWQHTFGTSYNDFGSSMQQTTDGGYVIAGYSYSYTADMQVYLVKTDANGNLSWQNTYGGIFSDFGWCVQQTAEGGYIIAGETSSFGAGDQVYLIKTDANGNLTWQRTIGGSNGDYGCSVKQTSEGGFIIAGYTGSYGAGGYDVYLIKTDANGIQTWQRTYGGGFSDCGYDVQQTSDGGYVIIGYTQSFGIDVDDVYLIKTDANGDLTWQHTFGGGGFDDGSSVQQSADGGYILTGCSMSYGAGDFDVYLIKTDPNGNLTWQCTFGGNGDDYGNEVQQTLDSGFIIAGSTQSYGAGSRDVYLIKTEPEIIPPNVTIDLIPFTLPIQIPATGGSFSFYVFANNQDSANADVALWTRQILPNGTITGPILAPFTVNLPTGTRAWFRNQNVPGNAAPGQYKYIGYAGLYPNTIWSSDTITYTKLTTGNGPAIGDWGNMGDSFPSEVIAPLSRGDRGDLCVASPNPFNPTTAISFKLQAASKVTLTVYDTAGRLVAILADGWREAGTHEVTFDGSGLSSGIYLAQLDVVPSGSGTAPTTMVQKMVLLK